MYLASARVSARMAKSSPSFVVGGHGAAPAPAWAAAVQQLTEVGGSLRGFALVGIAPMVVTFIIFFVIGLALSLLKKARSGRSQAS